MALTAKAADIDVSGSHLIDYEDGTLKLVIKGALPIPLATDNTITLAAGDFDFITASIVTTAPIEMQGGGSMLNLRVKSNFTIPTTGIEIIIRNVSHFMVQPTVMLMLSGSDWASENIPIYHDGTGPCSGNIRLDLAASETSFSPNWEGNLTVPATVTVTAKNAKTGETDATANGKAVLYTGNGPITLLNAQSYLYADMVNGVGTATISKLTDMGALTELYLVNLQAAMPLYDAFANAPVTLSITPNPLSITGSVLDDKGNGMAGATVQLLTADGFMANRTTTNAAGQYKLYGLPKSSSYRVIAYKDDLYGEVTKNLLPQPATANIILYSQIKVTVNFYQNKATLDGTPNSNVVSPANLYAASTYTIEAYANANGTRPIAPVRIDGRDYYFKMADLINAGGQLYIKAVPYSKYQDPFIDNSSLLTNVDYATALDPYNIAMNLEERPVGSVTVKNTGNRFPMTVSFESNDGSETAGKTKYKEVIIQPGGQYTFTPPEGYKTPSQPIQVFVSGQYEYTYTYINMYNEKETKTSILQANRERYLMVAGMGRKSELALSTTDLSGGIYSYAQQPYVNKSFGDIVSISFKVLNHPDDTYTIELSPSLELPPNWKDYVSISFCEGNKIFTGDQVRATYNAAKNTLSISLVTAHTLMADEGTFHFLWYNFYAPSNSQSIWNNLLNSYSGASATNHNCKLDNFCGVVTYIGGGYHSWRTDGLGYRHYNCGFPPAVFNFAVKAKPGAEDITAHHCLLTLTSSISYMDEHIGSIHAAYDQYISAYHYNYNPPRKFSSLSFTTGYPLTLDAPSATNNGKIYVQGYAKPGAAVTINAEGYGSLKTLTANSAGRYSGAVTLPAIEQSKDIKISATSGSKTSNRLTVRFSKRLLYAKELWMNSKQAGSFDKSYLLINSSVQIVDGAPAIVDAQSGKTQNIMMGNEAKFRVKMSDDDAIQKVFVSVERADGSAMGSVPCPYNPGTGYWESAVQDGTNWNGASSFRVTYVLNLGHEYMSPAEIAANMRATDAALVAWTPPQRMFIDIWADNERIAQLNQYKRLYEGLTDISNMLKERMSLACGEKEDNKSQGNYNIIFDPQGTVYDGTLEHPVAGVRAELWTANDETGAGAKYWNVAEDYDQINPQITAEDGMFSWFTPEGWWQVRVFDNAANAELKRSEWLKVLPPHYGVNLNIGKEPVTLTYDPNGGFLNMPVIDTLSTDSAFFYPYEELLKELPKMEFSLRYGSSHTVDSCMFVRNDSIFTGWNTKADGSGTKYAPNDVIPNIQADMTLYAQWVHSPTAIPTIAKAAHSIVVYPNPTKGELRMESGEWRVLRFSIFSVENSQLSPLSILNSQLIRWIFRICRLVSTF